MPNGRRGEDPTKDFGTFLLEKIEESDEWEVVKNFGASTAWEGEVRLVLKRKDSDKNVYMWLDETCNWGNYKEASDRLSDIIHKLEEIGLDL